MAEPTIAEAARVLRRMHGAGTVRRLDFLHGVLRAAYATGRADEARERQGEPESESCLEG